jgi:hypothetical protein
MYVRQIRIPAEDKVRLIRIAAEVRLLKIAAEDRGMSTKDTCSG